MDPTLSNLKVANLFIPGYKAWDVAKVSEIFIERDRVLILSIPLTTRRIEDD